MESEIANFKPNFLQHRDSNTDFLSENFPKPLIIRLFARGFQL